MEPLRMEMEVTRLEEGASSNVVSIGYCKPSQVLEVEFKDGSQYHYYRVGEQTYEDFKATESKGRFVHSHLKGYHYQQVKPPRQKTPEEKALSPRPQDKMRRKPSEQDEQTKFIAVFARNGNLE